MVKWSLKSSHFFFLPYNDPDLHGLQGYQAVQLLHTALGSPSTPQATPTPLPRGAKTFQKAKSMLSFRHQSSTAAAPAASFGTGRSSMLPAAHLVPAQGKAFPPADYCLTSAMFCCFWAIYKAQQCRPFPYLTPFLCVQKARQCPLFLFFKPVLAPWRQSLAFPVAGCSCGPATLCVLLGAEGFTHAAQLCRLSFFCKPILCAPWQLVVPLVLKYD